MFLQASVILLTGGGVPDQVHPPDQVPPSPPPGPGTPPWDQVHPRDQVHPPGTRYTPPGPGTPSRLIQIFLIQIFFNSNFLNSNFFKFKFFKKIFPKLFFNLINYYITLPPPRPGRYGLRVGGTHPTGMHSCLFYVSFWKSPFGTLP